MAETCLTCGKWKRRGGELVGTCSHPDSTYNADHPSNSSLRHQLHAAGEDFRRFFWTAEDYGCSLHLPERGSDMGNKAMIPMLYDLLEMAADLYADGDKNRIKLHSSANSGNLEVYVDGRLIDGFDGDGEPVFECPAKPRTPIQMA